MSSAFAAEAAFELVEQVAADAEAIDLTLRVEPDVVSIDAALPAGEGVVRSARRSRQGARSSVCSS